MPRLLITFVTLLAALTCWAQSPVMEAQDIPLGSTASEVIAALRTSTTVVDTGEVTAHRPNDLVIRIAPVKLCGMDGYLALHTNRHGIVTHFFWTRQPKYRYFQDTEQWQVFRGWDDWAMNTEADFETLRKKLEKELGEGEPGVMMPVRQVKDVKEQPSSEGLRHPRVLICNWKNSDGLIALKLYNGTLEFSVQVDYRKTNYQYEE